MKEKTWNKELWVKIEEWIDIHNNPKTNHLASSYYAKVEEFIQGLLDEKEKCIMDLEREVYLLKDEVEFVSKGFTMGK